MVLERIIDRKKQEVTLRKQRRPLQSFRESLVNSDRSLEQALKEPQQAYILECKRASPSRGLIAPQLDLDDLIAAYRPFASAISVLTDKVDFGGSFEDLSKIRSAVPQPVLCKDFVIDPYQVYEARSHGADAILLMLSVLGDEDFRHCFSATQELAMDALVEVHDRQELDRAIALGARIIGVNNRNLKDLSIDLATTEQLSPLIPKDRVVISESGLLEHAHSVRLRNHCDAFLVGTALLLEGDPKRAVRDLIFGRVKVCGLTRPSDASAAELAGARFGGLIFAKKSPRYLTLERAKEVQSGATLDWVGVFVDDSIDTIATHARELGLHAVQLHGQESPAFAAELFAKLPENCKIWQAVGVTDEVPSLPYVWIDKVLLDTQVDGQSGGTGRSFDWSILEANPPSKRWILAGGLKPENAARADALGAYALDVSSGLEASPGIKDPALIAAFFEALRG